MRRELGSRCVAWKLLTLLLEKFLHQEIVHHGSSSVQSVINTFIFFFLLFFDFWFIFLYIGDLKF